MKSAPRKKSPKKVGPKRPLTSYQKFIKVCAKTPEGKTRSGKEMIKWCAGKWRALSDAEKKKY
jgi:hypothetical protein